MALPLAVPVALALGRFALGRLAARSAAATVSRAGTSGATTTTRSAATQSRRIAPLLGEIAQDADLEGLEATGEVLGSGMRARDADEEDSHTGARPIPGEISDADTDEDCNDCEPREGQKVAPRGRNVNTAGGQWVGYQLKIANMGGHPIFEIERGKPQEWEYNNVEFDGFWSASCTLVEAKAGYESWLERDRRGQLHPRNLPFMSGFGEDFFEQAVAQYQGVKPNMPTAKLIWFFSSEETKEYVGLVFARQGLPIPCQYEPL